MKILLDKVKTQLENNLPFVIYNKPNDKILKAFFQKNDTLFSLKDFKEKGFVFSSFDGSKRYYIPENESEVTSMILEEEDSISKENSIAIPNEIIKIEFEKLVKRGIDEIKNTDLQKVVLSRKELIFTKESDLIFSFQKLLQWYPSTFVYCFFHPKIGIWMGATPEQLVVANKKSFKTVSLAGTQKDTGEKNIIWNRKEQVEQQYVTDYIFDQLKIVASQVQISKPYSVKAGSIWHIKTDLSGVLKKDASLEDLILLLHPTPAVCGFPKEISKKFILENENYDRNYYTGYLGELNIENQTDLFVNLRCMEIILDINNNMNQVHLFMGCGITIESLPQKEWEESVNKSLIMKKVLNFDKFN